MKQDIDMPEDVRMGSYSDIRLAEHERVLKRALFVKVSMARSFGFSALMRWLSYSKVFVGFTAGFAFALALFGTAYLGRENSALADFNPLATGQAKAKAAVQASIKETTKLSPTEQTKASQRIQADVKHSLEEALKAPDVSVVSVTDSEEMQDTAPGDSVILNVNGEVVDARADAKKLVEVNRQVRRKVKFTDKSGATVILGLDAKNLPVLKAVETGRKGRRGVLDGLEAKNKDSHNQSGEGDKRSGGESESKGEDR